MNHHRSTGSAAGILVLALFTGIEPAAAGELGKSGLEPGQQAHGGFPLGDPCSFTQNEYPDLLEAGSAIACQKAGITTDNRFLRLFDLDGDHGLSGQVCVDSLDYGVEQAVGDPELTFRVYCVVPGIADDYVLDAGELDPGLVFSFTTEQPDAELEFFSQPLGGCCDAATQDMVIEIATEDCLENGTCQAYYPGSNFWYPDTTWYIGAPDCGIDDPLAMSLIIFEDSPVVMTVHGTCGSPGVPATTGFGVLLLTLGLAGLGVRFVPRGRLGT